LVIDSMGEGKAEKQETNKKQKNKNWKVVDASSSILSSKAQVQCVAYKTPNQASRTIIDISSGRNTNKEGGETKDKLNGLEKMKNMLWMLTRIGICKMGQKKCFAFVYVGLCKIKGQDKSSDYFVGVFFDHQIKHLSLPDLMILDSCGLSRPQFGDWLFRRAKILRTF
jgi:hypothetical protein